MAIKKLKKLQKVSWTSWNSNQIKILPGCIKVKSKRERKKTYRRRYSHHHHHIWLSVMQGVQGVRIEQQQKKKNVRIEQQQLKSYRLFSSNAKMVVVSRKKIKLVVVVDIRECMHLVLFVLDHHHYISFFFWFDQHFNIISSKRLRKT